MNRAFKKIRGLLIDKKIKRMQVVKSLREKGVKGETDAEVLLRCHLGSVEKVDFWKIAPEEGKFVMAAAFQRTRQKARVWTLLQHHSLY